jgi:hypothetical protein
LVRVFSFLFLILFLTSNAYTSIVLDKVESFVGEKTYSKHKRLITSIFKNEADFIKNKDKVNSLLIIKKLRKYGLFNLFTGGKRNFEINIKAKINNNLIFFIKNIKDSFLDLGFNYIFIKNIKYFKQDLNLKLFLTSEATINPISLHKELQKRGIEILDINRYSNTIWEYHLSSLKLKLYNAFKIENNIKVEIKKIITDIHLNITNSRVIKITSSVKNKWHPYVVFFDKTLNPIKIIEKDNKTNTLKLRIPAKTKYIKITDKYVIKNIKHGISVLLSRG